MYVFLTLFCLVSVLLHPSLSLQFAFHTSRWAVPGTVMWRGAKFHHMCLHTLTCVGTHTHTKTWAWLDRLQRDKTNHLTGLQGVNVALILTALLLHLSLHKYTHTHTHSNTKVNPFTLKAESQLYLPQYII